MPAPAPTSKIEALGCSQPGDNRSMVVTVKTEPFCSLGSRFGWGMCVLAPASKIEAGGLQSTHVTIVQQL